MVFKGFQDVFHAYTYRDKFWTTVSLVVIILMLIKLILFPGGIGIFGSAKALYTEGLVSKNGIQNLNPLFVEYNEADRDISSLIFSGLMKYDPKTKQIVDDMATLTVNEDKTEYNLQIKDTITWHDGEEFNSDDVKFTIQDTILAPYFPNEILKANFQGVKLEIIDDKNIKFTLEKPNVFFINNLTVGMLPEHLLKDVEPDELLQAEFNSDPIGTGPYKISEPVKKFLDGRWQITLKRYDNYYAAQPEIQLMRFTVYQEMSYLLEDTGSMNGVVKITGENLLDFKEQERFNLIPYQQPQYMGIFMNTDSSILKDNKNVRLGLQKAIDKEELIEGREDLSIIDTPLLELNQEDWIYQANLEQANGALKEGGYSYAEEDTEKTGIRYNDNGDALELRLIVRAYQEGSEQMEQIYQMIDYLTKRWAQIGVAIDVEYLNLSDFNTAVSTRQYDLLFIGHNLGYNLDTYSYWHSAQANPRGQNFSNYGSFQVDTLIENIRSTFDQEKKSDLLKQLAEQIKTDVPAIFLFRPIYYYASDSQIEGLSMENLVFPSDRFFQHKRMEI